MSGQGVTAATATRLGNLSGVLGLALARWAERDLAKGADACQVRAGNEAMATIDDALTALHRLRGQLVTERRADSGARAARADAMLAEARKRREEDR